MEDATDAPGIATRTERSDALGRLPAPDSTGETAGRQPGGFADRRWTKNCETVKGL